MHISASRLFIATPSNNVVRRASPGSSGRMAFKTILNPYHWNPGEMRGARNSHVRAAMGTRYISFVSSSFLH